MNLIKLKRLEEAEMAAAIEHQSAEEVDVQTTWDAWMVTRATLEEFLEGPIIRRVKK